MKEDNKKIWEEMNDLKKLLKQNSNSNITTDTINFNNLSTIVSSKDEINFILNYIKENDKSLNINSLNLLFRGSRDGDSTVSLHNKCDDKNNILILIKSTIGYIFGGYCKIGFHSQNRPIYKIDNNCFLFSVNLKKIYPVIKDTKPICDIENSYGLCFYSCLLFYDKFMQNNSGQVCPKNNNYFSGILYNYEMNGRNLNFKCQDLEIFQLN